MKLSKLFFGVAAAAMFAACSSDDIVAEQPQPQWNEDGTGYIALNVTMPTAPVSRAYTGNDNYGDGLSKEYDVKNGVLLLFAGEKEGNATLYAAYDLQDTNFGMVGSEDDNVTSDKLIVQQIKRPDFEADYIGAFVVLNTNNNFIVNGSTHNLTSPSGVTTLASLQDKMRTDVGSGDPSFVPNEFIGNGFMMTNAPLYTTTGGVVGNLQVLAEVNQDKIMGSKNLASQKANCAANVYVERAVAKVTMHEGYVNVPVTTVTTPGQTNFTWTLNSWALDNTNRKSFLTRNTAGFGDWVQLKSLGGGVADYRFVGGVSVQHGGSSVGADGVTPLYRTYWAKDPNYSSDEVGTDFNINTADDHYSTYFGEKYPQYCAENTFDVEHMDWQNTTRVLLKTTMVPDATTKGTLYGRPGDEGFLTEDNVAIIAYNTALEELKGKPGFGGLQPGTITLASWTSNATTGNITVKLAGLVGTDAASNALATTYTDGVSYTPAQLGLSYYKGGVVYYQTRIRHFDDTQTPWNVDAPNNEWLAGFKPASGSTLSIYPKANDERADANYLGRWGVLRNNWYDIEITKVTKLGYADPNQLILDTTPDDNIESWISVDVNILSWTKRTTPSIL